jgi:hypothetical protein
MDSHGAEGSMADDQMSTGTPTNSKKYLAVMRFTRDWTLVLMLTLGALGTATYFKVEGLGAGLISVLIAEIVVLGFVQVLYLGGQSAVDTFVRMAVVIVTGRKNGAPDPKPTPDPTPAPSPTPVLDEEPPMDPGEGDEPVVEAS